MILSVKDRLILLNVLPAEGDITTLRIVHNLRNALSFSEEEHRDLNITETETGVKWDVEKEAPKEVEIGNKASSIIQNTLRSLSSSHKLRLEHLPLYEKFVTSEE